MIFERSLRVKFTYIAKKDFQKVSFTLGSTCSSCNFY